MSCTWVYDGNKQHVFSVEYKGRGAWRDAMLSVEHLPFLKAPRWMPEGYRLAIKVERLPAPDYSWSTASIAEEQVLRTMQSPLLPRYYGSLKTYLDGQAVSVLAMQAAHKTVEDYIASLHGVTPSETNLAYLWKGISETLVGMCDEWLVHGRSHQDLCTL